ncbi:nitroalkane oxidase [Murinocardiopsis flavida]|uniref:Nitroalkane oxidase n=1 Tax=Murinocardiopsis flavida TaxID=645275 RepID=A0A2P8DP92_9ACTN|nr:nitronate monooxygenase [Murinocardiopsis flavida]PSK99042.1 nitroalkane oxidase [Murinocardiopsis flavida]
MVRGSGGVLDGVDVPLIAAPMAGGASTPDLVAAVAGAGALGFLAAGYRSTEAMAEQIRLTRLRTDRPFGVNLFVPGPDRADPAALRAYRARLEPEARTLGVELGEPRWHDDDFAAKVDALIADPVPHVGFTFGLPPERAVAALRKAGTVVTVTVTSAAEASAAARSGADALCVQGPEAGGHRGTFDDTGRRGAAATLEQVLAEVRAAVALPLVAAGGIADADAAHSVRAAGAVAAQAGTAFLRTAESGAKATHKDALADERFQRTAVTRAFSGRSARGLANAFLRRHSAHAPAAYPHVHYLTGPLRAEAARVGDADTLHLWAGTSFRSAAAGPAADVVAGIAAGL